MASGVNSGLGFAIVGYGRIGQRHAGHILKFGRLEAVCDIDPAARAAAEREHGAKTYADFADMLSALRGRADLIAICTPNGLHSEHAIKAFEAGFHVLCEKPMAITVRECGEMIKAGERANRRLFVVKQNRYNPPVEHLKKLLDDNVLGRVFSVHLNCYWNRDDAYYANSWKGTRAMDGGTLYTQFSHFIDLLYWMVGDVKEVHAYMDNFQHGKSIAFEDSGVAILRFHGGTIGSVNFTINSYGKNMEGSITLFCENGTVKIGGQYLNEIEYENIRGMAPSQIRPGRTANDYGQYQGSMSNHEDIYANVVEVLTGDGSISTVGYEGMKTVEIIDKIYTAARAAGWK